VRISTYVSVLYRFEANFALVQASCVYLLVSVLYRFEANRAQAGAMEIAFNSFRPL